MCTIALDGAYCNSCLYAGLTSRSTEEQKPDLEIPGLKPANQAVLPIPKKADAKLGDFPDFSLQVNAVCYILQD